MKRVRVIVNPSACSSRGPRALRRAGLYERQHGAEVEWIESRSAAHLGELVRAADADPGLSAIGLAGGDGTVNLALAALGGPNRVPIGLLPVGSGNDFAKDAGVPRAPGPAFNALLAGVPRWVDTGRILPAGGPASAAPFCCVASVGLDDLALHIIHHSMWPRSKALNIYAALRALCSYRPRPVKMTWEGGGYEGEVMFAAVTSTRSYGGGFLVSPAARLDDGLLDVCIVRGTSRARLLGHFPRILRGTHGALPDVILAQSPWVRIDAPAPLPVAVDGELPRETTPVELRCAPRSACVLVPEVRSCP
jgi:diacylglycerol kinase (ATP)